MITCQRVEGSILADYTKPVGSCLLPSHLGVKMPCGYLHHRRDHVPPVCVSNPCSMDREVGGK